MADLNDILNDLRAEIVEKILQIAVKEKGSGETTFEYHLPSKGPIEESTGRPRLFGVRLASVESKWCGVGGGVQRYDLVWEVKIGYPLRDWEIAMVSDYDQLRTALNVNGAVSSTTGCGFRHVPLKGFLMAPGTNWIWAICPVNAVIETA